MSCVGAISSPLKYKDYYYTKPAISNNIEGKLIGKQKPYIAVRSEDIAYIGESIHERYALVEGKLLDTNTTYDALHIGNTKTIPASILNSLKFLDKEYKLSDNLIKIKRPFAVTNFFSYQKEIPIITPVEQEFKQLMADGTTDIFKTTTFKLDKETRGCVLTNINYGLDSPELAQIFADIKSNNDIFSSTGKCLVMSFDDVKFTGRPIKSRPVAESLYHINDAVRFGRIGFADGVVLDKHYSNITAQDTLFAPGYDVRKGEEEGTYEVYEWKEAAAIDQEFVNGFELADDYSGLFFPNVGFSIEKTKEVREYIYNENPFEAKVARGSPVVIDTHDLSFAGQKLPQTVVVLQKKSTDNVLRPEIEYANDMVDDIRVYGVFEVEYNFNTASNVSYIVSLKPYTSKAGKTGDWIGFKLDIPDTRKILTQIMRNEGVDLSLDLIQDPQRPQLEKIEEEERDSMWQSHVRNNCWDGNVYTYLPMVRSASNTTRGYALMRLVTFISIIDLKPKTLIEGSK
jgi:hypothetical protein